MEGGLSLPCLPYLPHHRELLSDPNHLCHSGMESGEQRWPPWGRAVLEALSQQPQVPNHVLKLSHHLKLNLLIQKNPNKPIFLTNYKPQTQTTVFPHKIPCWKSATVSALIPHIWKNQVLSHKPHLPLLASSSDPSAPFRPLPMTFTCISRMHPDSIIIRLRTGEACL